MLVGPTDGRANGGASVASWVLVLNKNGVVASSWRSQGGWMGGFYHLPHPFAAGFYDVSLRAQPLDSHFSKALKGCATKTRVLSFPEANPDFKGVSLLGTEPLGTTAHFDVNGVP